MNANIPRNIPNPLGRDGTNQGARLLEALKPSSVKIDGKGIDDWLRDARKYAELLCYYNQENVVDGDWVKFIERDISSLITLVNADKPTDLRKAFFQKLEQLAPGEAEENTRLLTELLVTLQNYAHQIFLWLEGSNYEGPGHQDIQELAIQTELKRLVPSVIDDGYKKLLKYLDEGDENGLVYRTIPKGNFHLTLLEEQWPLAPIKGTFSPFANGIPVAAADIEQEQKLLKALYDRFYEVHLSLYQQADAFMQNSLNDFPAHQSHIALFLACLRVFEFGQTALNELTEKHLDFYYKDVLKLSFRKEVADRVHLILELAQNFVDAQIKKDRVFLAGQDVGKKDLFYAADNELIVNKAQIDTEVGLKALLVDKDYEFDENGSRSFEIVNIHAAPDADSENGLGEGLLSPDQQWSTFGTNDSAKTPFANIGFAIASPMFFLKEGKRELKLKFHFSNLQTIIDKYGRSVIKTELKHNVTVCYTGEEGWFEVPVPQVSVEIGNEVEYIIDIQEGDPSVIAYDEETHQSGFKTRFPVVKFLLKSTGLSANGNLDLNLSAGIENIDEVSIVLANEFVYSIADSGGWELSRANGDFRVDGNISGDSFLWELKIDEPGPYISPPPNPSIPPTIEEGFYSPGDLINVDGDIYKANVSISGVPPSVDRTIWVNLSEGSYVQDKQYFSGDIVGHLGKIWIAVRDTKVEPGSDLDVNNDWLQYLSFDLGTEYAIGDLVIYEGIIYEAIAVSLGIIPPTNIKILTLIEGISEFNPSRLGDGSSAYKKGDLVDFEITDSNGNEIGFIYRLNSENTLTTPDEGKFIFEFLQDALDYSGPHSINEYVENNAKLYQLIAADNIIDSNNFFEPPLDINDNNLNPIIWQAPPMAPLDFEVFKNQTSQPKGTLVYDEENGKTFLYRFNALSTINVKEEQIEPVLSEDLMIWQAINVLTNEDLPDIDGDTVPDINVVELDDIYTPQDITGAGPIELYKLLALSTDIFPSSGVTTRIWQEIDTVVKVYAGPTDPDLFAGIIVRVVRPGDTRINLYELRVDPPDPGNPQLPNPWESTTEWRLLTDPITDPDGLFDNYDISNTNHPDFLKGQYVHVVISSEDKYFVSNAKNNISPTSEINIWEHLTPTGKDLIDFDVQPHNFEAEAGRYCKLVSSFYLCNATTEGVSPANNEKIWVKLNFSDISDPPSTADSDKIFKIGDYIRFKADFFIANANTKFLDPANEDRVWIDLDPPYTYINSKSDLDFSGGNIYRYNNGFFLWNADSKNINPDKTGRENQLIWEIIHLKPVDEDGNPYPYILYQGNNESFIKGNYIKEEGVGGNPPKYFLANAGGKLTDTPTKISEIGVWQTEEGQQIFEFSPLEFYNTGSIVSYQGEIFLSQGGVIGILPDSGLKIWEKFDEDEIPIFNESQYYPVGNYVKVIGEDGSETIFKANAGTQNIFPINHDMFPNLARQILEPVSFVENPDISIIIEPYKESVTYQEGSYVFLDGEIYRAKEAVFDIRPDEDPTKWKQVGEIESFLPTQSYPQYSNVEFEGIVYEALKFIDPSDPPKLPPDYPDCWRIIKRSYPYKYFFCIDIERLDIDVCVQGVKDLILENDDGIIDPAKPFNPFGGFPKKKSNFYIGSQEIFQKKLADKDPNIVMNIEWGDLPECNFGRHYQYYIDDQNNVITFDSSTGINNESNVKIDNNSFQTKVFSLNNGEWVQVEIEDEVEVDEEEEEKEKSLALFDEEPKDPNDPDGEQVPIEAREIELNKDILSDRDPSLKPFIQFTPALSRGFIKLELVNDFLHSNYPKSLAYHGINEDEDKLPNEPYTPLINAFSLDYYSCETIVYKGLSRSDLDNRVEQFFHIHPFGQTEFLPIKDDDKSNPVASPFLVPTFDVPVFDEQGDQVLVDGNPKREDAAGTLFIGIKDAKPLQNISILFQVAASSENPDRLQERIIWSYLEDNRWVEFPAGTVLNDTTNSFLTSGIIQFAMPRKIVTTNSILPAGLFWIKASVVSFPDSVAKMITINTQAVQASFRNTGENDPRHLANPLEAGKISQLQQRLASIKKISQPYASFGGRTEEEGLAFYTRVSERLRHKGRGINVFDIERLVLEAFPNIFKVKCLNHTTDTVIWKKDEETPASVLYTHEHSPGFVKVVVLPNLRNQNAVNPLQPRVSRNTLSEIKEFLEQRLSGFVELEVANPRFEEVKVKADIVFQPGRDKEFHKKQLNIDIRRFLSPWLFDEGADLPFTASFHRSLILAFMDGLEYIDYVVDMSLQHTLVLVNDEGDRVEYCEKDLEEIRPSTGSSVLVSAEQHDLEAILEENLPCAEETEVIVTSSMK